MEIIKSNNRVTVRFSVLSFFYKVHTLSVIDKSRLVSLVVMNR